MISQNWLKLWRQHSWANTSAITLDFVNEHLCITNLSQRWNHTDWTLSDPKNLQQRPRRRRILGILLYLIQFICLQCLSWIVLVHLLDTFFFWLLTQHEVFDISRTAKFKNPHNANQFQERSFLRKPPYNFVTNGLTRTVYKNIKIQWLLQNMTKYIYLNMKNM